MRFVLFFCVLISSTLPNFSLSYAFSNPQGVSFRIFEDTRPHNLQVRSLQKGLVMYNHGNPIIDGGLGFGVPALKLDNKWYYSKKAKVEQYSNEIHKRFFLDCYRVKHGGEISYKDVDGSVGSVLVVYTILPQKVRILLDLTSLPANYDQLIVLNEQSGTYFNVFVESDLSNDVKNGNYSWVSINKDCSQFANDSGMFISKNKSCSFRIQCQRGAHLVRSRQVVDGAYNYSGLQFEILGGLPSLYYDVFYDSPENSPDWINTLPQEFPIKSK